MFYRLRAAFTPESLAGSPVSTMLFRCRAIAVTAIALLTFVACGPGEPTTTPGSPAPTLMQVVSSGVLAPFEDATATPARPTETPVPPADSQPAPVTSTPMASPVPTMATPAPSISPPEPTATTESTLPSTTAGLVVDVPLGLSPILDGVLEPGEWAGALQDDLSDGGELFLMHDGEYLYVGIRASAKGSGVGSICIDRGQQVAILHSSAALGTAIYENDGAEWQQIQEFSWYCRSTGSSAAAQDERSEFLQTEGWLANIGRMGVPEEVEYQIAMPEGSLRLAVTFLGPPSFDSVAAWPQDLVDDCQNIELITGPVPEHLQFSPQTWMTVSSSGKSTPGP